MERARLFLTILRGTSPRDARPVVATEDQALIRAVARALNRRLDVGESEHDETLEFPRDEEDGHSG